MGRGGGWERAFVSWFACTDDWLDVRLEFTRPKGKAGAADRGADRRNPRGGIYPDDRVGLYTKFIDEHAITIKGLTSRAKSGARAQRLDGELQDLTALMDELGTNLDVYSDRKADIRKALKNLTQLLAPRWLGILRALAGDPGFELARKEAIESGEDLADQAKRLLTEQTDYFNEHKDEKGQERAEPK